MKAALTIVACAFGLAFLGWATLVLFYPNASVDDGFAVVVGACLAGAAGGAVWRSRSRRRFPSP